jgi:DNA-binding NarL/FixJ family response regulator
MNPSTLPYHTRVQLAVPRKIFPDCLARLRKSRRFRMIGEGVFSGADLLEAIEANRPDILLLDLTLPDLDSKKVLPALADRTYPPYVVATAPYWEPLLVKARAHRVVRGILPHPLALSPVLPHVLAGIAEGCEYVVPRVPVDHRLFGLTGDELVLLGLMAAGLEACEIMQELDCTINVVYTNQSQLRKKLGVPTNEKAILLAIRVGLIGVLSEVDHLIAAGGSR